MDDCLSSESEYEELKSFAIPEEVIARNCVVIGKARKEETEEVNCCVETTTKTLDNTTKTTADVHEVDEKKIEEISRKKTKKKKKNREQPKFTDDLDDVATLNLKKNVEEVELERTKDELAKETNAHKKKGKKSKMKKQSILPEANMDENGENITENKRQNDEIKCREDESAKPNASVVKKTLKEPTAMASDNAAWRHNRKRRGGRRRGKRGRGLAVVEGKEATPKKQDCESQVGNSVPTNNGKVTTKPKQQDEQGDRDSRDAFKDLADFIEKKYRFFITFLCSQRNDDDIIKYLKAISVTTVPCDIRFVVVKFEFANNPYFEENFQEVFYAPLISGKLDAFSSRINLNNVVLNHYISMKTAFSLLDFFVHDDILNCHALHLKLSFHKKICEYIHLYLGL